MSQKAQHDTKNNLRKKMQLTGEDTDFCLGTFSHICKAWFAKNLKIPQDTFNVDILPDVINLNI